eukprot:TRINITY_DN2716_c0_g1_i3.p1 TRINITY_DN2716_c0_g1~~TRINITY_DN2716_c0_g1_i3.p1  ORF type:complete len:909 (+),score=159.81 TRINITY_DN2716_c0_g1_i3:490-3216(+)
MCGRQLAVLLLFYVPNTFLTLRGFSLLLVRYVLPLLGSMCAAAWEWPPDPAAVWHCAVTLRDTCWRTLAALLALVVVPPASLLCAACLMRRWSDWRVVQYACAIEAPVLVALGLGLRMNAFTPAVALLEFYLGVAVVGHFLALSGVFYKRTPVASSVCNTFLVVCRFALASVGLAVACGVGALLAAASYSGMLFCSVMVDPLSMEVSALIVVYLAVFLWLGSAAVVGAYSYVLEFWKAVKALRERFTTANTTLLFCTLLVGMLAAVVHSCRTPIDSLQLLQDARNSVTLQRELLTDTNLAHRVRQDLLDLYLSEYRYADNTRVKFESAVVQSLANLITAPFFFRGGRTSCDTREFAAHEYLRFTGTPILRGEQQAILQATVVPLRHEYKVAATLDSIEEMRVFLVSQHVNVTSFPQDCVANVVVHEEYLALQESGYVLYYFTLPSYASVTSITHYDEPQITHDERISTVLLEQVGPQQYRLSVEHISHRSSTHVSFTYSTPLSSDGTWPLPQILERRNVFWDVFTRRTLTVDGATASARRLSNEWMPLLLHDVQCDAARMLNRPVPIAVGGSVQCVSAYPLKLEFGITKDFVKPVAIVIHRTPALQSATKEVESELLWAKKELLPHTPGVDVYLTTAPFLGNNETATMVRASRTPGGWWMRQELLPHTPLFESTELKGTEALRKPLESLNPDDLLMFGWFPLAVALNESLVQMGEITVDKYSAVFVLTDSSTTDLASHQKLGSSTVPFWIVHADGQVPRAYEDAVWQLVVESKGGFTTSLQDAVARYLTPGGNTYADGIAWRAEEVPSSNVPTPSASFQAIAARQLVQLKSSNELLNVTGAEDALRAVALSYHVVMPCWEFAKGGQKGVHSSRHAEEAVRPLWPCYSGTPSTAVSLPLLLALLCLLLL